jgi:ubiquitin carboxyl-terminal hydrolase 22/27/51
MTCGFTSTTDEPCVDISLDLDTSNFSPKNIVNKPIKSNENSSVSSLLGCLDLFTRQEKLGSDQKLHCRNCQEMRDSVKQMSIKRLPLVLCLHIKRFEHSPVRRMSRKIDRHLHFPFSLDMTHICPPPSSETDLGIESLLLRVMNQIFPQNLRFLRWLLIRGRLNLAIMLLICA